MLQIPCNNPSTRENVGNSFDVCRNAVCYLGKNRFLISIKISFVLVEKRWRYPLPIAYRRKVRDVRRFIGGVIL